MTGTTLSATGRGPKKLSTTAACWRISVTVGTAAVGEGETAATAEAVVAAEEVRDGTSADEDVFTMVVVFAVLVPEEKALPIKNMDNPIIIKIITRIKRRRKSMILRFLIRACLLCCEGGLG